MRGDRIQEFEETLDAVGWEFNGHDQRVESPTKDHLPGSTSCITFDYFLQRCRFLVIGIVPGFQASEYSSQGMQKRVIDVSSVRRAALDHANIDVPLLHCRHWHLVVSE
jgi:hypothetical protein